MNPVRTHAPRLLAGFAEVGRTETSGASTVVVTFTGDLVDISAPGGS